MSHVSQIPVLNLQHAHAHKRQIKQCLQKISTVLLAVANVMKWKDGQDQQKLFTRVEAYICIIRTLTWASHSGALSIASCAKPVSEGLSPTLPAPSTHKFLTILFSKPRVHCRGQKIFSGVSSQGSHCFFAIEAQINWSHLSVSCGRGLSGVWGFIICFLADFC